MRRSPSVCRELGERFGGNLLGCSLPGAKRGVTANSGAVGEFLAFRLMPDQFLTSGSGDLFSGCSQLRKKLKQIMRCAFAFVL